MQHQITLAQAIELTSNFRANPGEDMPYAETFSAGPVKALLEQEGCHSFRIYLGRKTDDRICSVLVAVNENGQDILPQIILPYLQTTKVLSLKMHSNAPRYAHLPHL